ncbi:MAG: diaminopimelate decarboxylase [Candidatus Cloacimonetes bacterium]|nr:diaminopimelate decarboxylase [Candidatus Cloacimonadota bacterium]
MNCESSLKLENGKYMIRDIDILGLCKKYGTPLYVYDAAKISEQIALFRRAFKGIDLKIKFAAKSLSNINILKLMKKEGIGLDTVSLQEIQFGLQAGFSPEEIVYTPNIEYFSEIIKAAEMGVSINIENLSNLEKFGKEFGNRIPCCIRLNPNIIAEAEREKVSNWHNQSKFGISLFQFDKLEKLVEKYHLRINGIHIHSSHAIMTTEIFLKGAKIIFDLAKKFPDLEYFDFGGGIKVADFEGENVIDIVELGAEFKVVFDEFCAEYGRKLQLWFEPGRFLVGESGYLLTEVVVRKTNGDVEFAGVDSGFNHLIRPMMYGAFHEIVNISKPNGIKQKYSVVGNLCEIDDFGRDRMLNEVSEGDILMIKNAGAYGFVMSSNYNARFRPPEILIINEEAELIRKRETMEDLLRNQIEIEI